MKCLRWQKRMLTDPVLRKLVCFFLNKILFCYSIPGKKFVLKQYFTWGAVLWLYSRVSFMLFQNVWARWLPRIMFDSHSLLTSRCRGQDVSIWEWRSFLEETDRPLLSHFRGEKAEWTALPFPHLFWEGRTTPLIFWWPTWHMIASARLNADLALYVHSERQSNPFHYPKHIINIACSGLGICFYSTLIKHLRSEDSEY